MKRKFYRIKYLSAGSLRTVSYRFVILKSLSDRKIYFSHYLRVIIIIMAILFSISSCYESETLNEPINETPDVLKTDLDKYIDQHFIQEYGMAIRYRFVDRYVSPTQRVTPPLLEVVRPMLDFIDNFWIDPYLSIDNGEEFFRKHVPAEIILLGGLIYNEDGTVILGQADAGARITFTDVNSLNPDDQDWVITQLHTVYHEFAHIVHQRYKLPASFETISPQGYTSAGSWFTLTDDEALQRGFVSPYATSDPNEDFAETVAFYLFDKQFNEKFIDQDTSCITNACELRNDGRKLIAEKLNAIKAHYKKVTGIDLEALREVIQSKL